MESLEQVKEKTPSSLVSVVEFPFSSTAAPTIGDFVWASMTLPVLVWAIATIVLQKESSNENNIRFIIKFIC
jgi:hypothetical protein